MNQILKNKFCLIMMYLVKYLKCKKKIETIIFLKILINFDIQINIQKNKFFRK